MDGVLEFGYEGAANVSTLERRLIGADGFDTLSVTACTEGDHTVSVRFWTATGYYTVHLNGCGFPPGTDGKSADMQTLLIPLSDFWLGETGNPGGTPVTGGLYSGDITSISIYISNWFTSTGITYGTWFDDIRLV